MAFRAARLQQRGAALLLVLWLIVLLTALVGSFALAARVEHMQGRALVRGLEADSAARAGLEYAVDRLAADAPGRRWLADGRVHEWHYRDARVEVRIVDETGKIDLNQADAGLLAGLLMALGSPSATAAGLAAAILDWRDPDTLTQVAGGAEDADYAAAGRAYGAKDAPFESIAELEQVLGFTPELYALVEPHVTVYGGLPRPDPGFASVPVLQALGLDGEAIVRQREFATMEPGEGMLASARPGGTYSIDSYARLADGSQSLLRATVHTGIGTGSAKAYVALQWEQGALPR